MTDTSFGPADPDRLAEAYARDPATGELVVSPLGPAALSAPEVLSGGGGLVSTAADYHRFTRMLLDGGELDGVRLLGTRTLRYMASNHLPGRADLEAFGRQLYAEVIVRGRRLRARLRRRPGPGRAEGALLARRVQLGRAGQHGVLGRPGRAHHARTFFTQMIPSSTYPLRIAVPPARLPGAGGLMEATR